MLEEQHGAQGPSSKQDPLCLSCYLHPSPNIHHPSPSLEDAS